MLYLLQPIWLLSGLSIAIPILIHLWNEKQGKIWKVGSIALLQSSSREYARSLRITEWLLLLLRCILLLLLSLLLAQPYLETKQKGWILMERSVAKQAYDHYKPLVDSLSQAGYEFHSFDQSFEKMSLAALLTEAQDSSANAISYWPLIQSLNGNLKKGAPVYLFTGNQLHRFYGKRPATHLSLTWETVTPADSTGLFIADAYSTATDSIAVVMGESRPSGTNYHTFSISTDKPVQDNISLSVTNGNMILKYKNDKEMIVDTSTWKICLYSDTYTNDLAYLIAALRSIQKVSKRRMKIDVIKNISQKGTYDWLFWLSEKQPPSNITAKHILRYDLFGSMSSMTRFDPAIAYGENINIYKGNFFGKEDGQSVWYDGHGQTLLGLKMENNTQLYTLYTRLNPSWNDLVWNAAFPRMIYGLMDRKVDAHELHNRDLSAIDTTQLQLSSPGKTNTGAAVQEDSSLVGRIIWILALIIFIAERYLSSMRQREKVNA